MNLILTNIVMGLSTTLGAAGAAMLVNSGTVWVAPSQAQSLSGTVSGADLESGTFGLVTEDGTTHTLSVNEETTYTFDGAESTAEEVLQTGAEVSAEVDENGLASSVSRTSA